MSIIPLIKRKLKIIIKTAFWVASKFKNKCNIGAFLKDPSDKIIKRYVSI